MCLCVFSAVVVPDDAQTVVTVVRYIGVYRGKEGYRDCSLYNSQHVSGSLSLNDVM